MASSTPDMTKLRESMVAVTDARKPLFSSKLTDQLQVLSAKLDPQQAAKLESIVIGSVVNDVSDKVVENVVAQGLVLLQPAVSPPLHLLDPEHVALLVGKLLTSGVAAGRVNEQLVGVAAATYASEIARAILEALGQIPKTGLEGQNSQTHDPACNGAAAVPVEDPNVKALISAAAIAGSPMGALYDPSGARLRALTFKDAGTIMMASAGFLGPEALVIGIGFYLVGAQFDI